MPPLAVLGLYCLLVAAASMLGGWLPTFWRLTHTRMQLLMSYLGGLLMGVGLLHLLPHAVVQLESIDPAVSATLVGLVVTLFLVRCFHFHQHDVPESAHSDCEHEHCHTHDHDHSHDHAHGGQLHVLHSPDAHSQGGHEHAGHSHSGHSHGGSAAKTRSRFSWLGLFFGLGLHTLMDGIALAASVAAEAEGNTVAAWAGLGTFLAVALHKPLDSLSITSVMRLSGWHGAWPKIINVVYALLCPIGAFAFYFGMGHSSVQSQVVGWALGLSAGVFLCIALVDVLPEIQFHSHDRFNLSIALLAGVATAYAIGLAESDHAHHFDDHHGHGHAVGH